MAEALAVTIDEAVSGAIRVLEWSPGLAAKQAEEILNIIPGEPRARLILGAARRRGGDAAAARTILEPLAREQRGAPGVQLETARVFIDLSDAAAAIVCLRRLTSLRRDDPDAWFLLADQLVEAGDRAAADDAFARYLRVSARDPLLREAALALDAERLAEAERHLRHRLDQRPRDVATLRMLGELATRLGRHAQAQALLERCLELAPSFHGARHNYAVVLYRRQKAAVALVEVDRLLALEPDEPSSLALKAAVLSLLGEFVQATAIYERLFAKGGVQPAILMSYGHALRASGRPEEAAAAYRRAIADGAPMGEAWWSLANLKTHAFSPADEVDIRRFLALERLGPGDRLHLAYALGKILEDRGEWAEAFQNYATGAAIHRRLYPFDIAAMRSQARGSRKLFTREFLGERADGGAASEAPIFILGLPRSGSTLIEQILASHSMVEGTFELPDIIAIARDLGGEGIDDPLEAVDRMLERMAALTPDERLRLGERYLAETAVHRRLGRPRFIDKMPNNCRYVGLIHLILPNARIIDARRHPMAAGFSAFKQHFARGYRFTYDLDDLGRYYADYVDLMRHFDQVLPGRVHRVIYEDLVADTEGEVRRLLDYLGLPFEEACLRFHETARPVRTASSEQVRQPIYREGLDHWRHFEPWLGSLKAALGEALETWRT